jgi:microcystin-dependent protein
MALETGTYIDDLVATNPAATDALSAADDHIRLIKSTIKATFPNITGPVTSTQAVLNTTFPAGGIVIWSGAEAAIPTGWVLCNGSNSTPDLREKFVMGAGTTAVNTTGGTNSLTIATANLPSHTHAISLTSGAGGSHTHSISDAGAHSHTFNVSGSPGSDSNNFDVDNHNNGNTGGDSASKTTSSVAAHTHTIGSESAHTHAISGTSAATGGATAIDNRPLYFSLCYIMKS